jgi:hypothetical protein
MATLLGGFIGCLFGTTLFHIFTTVHKHIVRREAVIVLTGTLQPCILEKKGTNISEELALMYLTCHNFVVDCMNIQVATCKICTSHSSSPLCMMSNPTK